MQQTMRIIVCGFGLLFGNFQTVHAGNPFVGKDLYKQHCASCHGERGESKMINVPNFARGEKVITSTEQMLLTMIRQGKGIMPAYRGIIKDSEILDIIAHLRTLY